jgi:peptidoglycan hydrolase-like protein with peptidoglycan-binding domain
MSRKRITVLLGVLAFVVVAFVGGWLGVSRIESPADVAARTAPPTPSPILVPIEERVLSSDVVTRGTARFGLPQPISIAPSGLKGQAGLITTLPQRNTQLREGSVMLTASGRPVLVLQGGTPAYRDLVPGISGADVRQLQRGLARLGFDPGPVDGTYDTLTSSAVAAWYRSAGWTPFGPTPEQLAATRRLRRNLDEAAKTRSATAGAAGAAALAVESARATAEHHNSVAAAELAAKTQERALIVVDPRQTETARAAADAALEQAQAGVKAARLAGDSAIQAAVEAQRVAELEAKLAAERADRLAADLRLAEHKTGVQVPVDEIVFIPTLPVRVEEVTARVGDTARGPVMSVTDNQLAVDSSLPLDAAPLVKPGMRVDIDEQALGIKARGTVKQVAVTPGTHGVDGYHIYFEVRVERTSSPLEGFSVRLTIPIESTKGVVTAVPISALSLAADGTSRVQVENNGTLQYVVVEPGLSADGFVEVVPVDGTLTPGQLVVVGYDNPQNTDEP